MKKGIIMFAALFVFALGVQAQKATVIINADKGEHTINKNIYGHFAEHLGRCIYDGIYVGDSSAIPNTEGVRTDIIDALIELKVPVLRWPGGCFADTYHWMDGIGDRADRPSIVNQWWGGTTEDNSFGTHDFLNLCERINAEPYLAGNVGSGQVKELADWVQYVNHTGGSPMSDLRIEHGRTEPWNVKYWGVGNEMWGCGGNMAPEFYANLFRQYSTFMTDWSNSDGLYRIASGANGADYNWTEVLMRDIPKPLIEGVALHSYSVIDWGKKGPAKDFSEELYFATMKSALFMEELVTKHIAIMDKYDPEQKVDLIVDEWGGWYDAPESQTMGVLYQQNTMRDAMIAGATLNIFNNHADRIKMANLAQIVNVLQALILTNEEKLVLTPTYHVMRMYNVHQDATLLPMELTTADYEYKGEKLPAVSGSASVDSEGVMHISLVNIDSKESQAASLKLLGTNSKQMSGEILASDKLQDYNSFENGTVISPKSFKGFKKKGDEWTVTLPPFSVVVLEVK
ncbi:MULTISPECIES: alpha-N-arabinofuranosidase [Reichenbachiella]|uniref:alpha-N-arabinofuranosidase n=1 Tax=Reichenbachiella TaxID=156993 RepID=UPI000E6D40B9|nr:MULTISPECIES: alpha-L-arabinofuranosidase C-terminal domain-containing protein [Reichenbachiella]MBU2912388.1 alpha-N-arabinofuranosidase [Reichenbachiella agariperforans]RJE72739.1 alpha-N-arabinofuranosidase [Reichenbachiella sp. MSK19-1]